MDVSTFAEYIISRVVDLSLISIPPAPFLYYATVRGNIPVALTLPTINVNIQFTNFTFGPPPSTTFDIPSNCTNTEFNPRLHPIFSQAIIENSGVEMLC